MNVNPRTLARLAHFVVLLEAVISASAAAAHLTSPNAVSLGIRSALASTNGFGLLSSNPSRAATSVATRSRRSGSPSSSRSARSRKEHFDRISNSITTQRDEAEVEFCSYASPPKGGKVDANSALPSPSPSPTSTSAMSTVSSGGSTAAIAVARRLHFWENMICGAASRSIAQTIMHPANTMKTILQSQRGVEASERLTVFGLAKPANVKLLTRGAGSQFLLSVPHGAVNFAVLEYVRRQMTRVTDQEWVRSRINVEAFSPGFDFLSSAISTICCSVVSTPQMMITDNIMAGTYPNLPGAIKGLAAEKGIKGFYAGWWPGLAGKIPSYALTWTLFQQLKEAHRKAFKRDPKDVENSVMGCLASAATVSVMIPLDTIKTRLVTQLNYPDLVPYKGIIDCGKRVFQEEGMIAFYRGLSPRLISVVPMIGIQFGVYEFMKKAMLTRGEGGPEARSMSDKKLKEAQIKAEERERESRERGMAEVAMEVAADDDQPFPAPHLGKKKWGADRLKRKSK